MEAKADRDLSEGSTGKRTMPTASLKIGAREVPQKATLNAPTANRRHCFQKKGKNFAAAGSGPRNQAPQETTAAIAPICATLKTLVTGYSQSKQTPSPEPAHGKAGMQQFY